MAIEINPSTPSSPIPTVNGISVIWLGDWDNARVYRRNEGVFHEGSSYRANKTTSEEPSATALDWDLIAQGTTIDDSTISNHIANTSNPHNVTPTQIGNSTAQWNADKIRGINVDNSAIGNGKILKYNAATTNLEYVNESGGGEVNTASNVGTAGVGIYRQKTGTNLEFKRLNAGSSRISITDDTTNSEVDVDVNEANLVIGNLAGTLPILKGGTGATNAAGARTNLSVPSTTDLTSHTGSTSNPHSVTASQVGNSTAQWNASQLQSRSVANTAPTNGQVLTYSTANTRWEPQTPASGGGAVIKVAYSQTSTSVNCDAANNPSSTGLAVTITPTSTSNFMYITGVLNNCVKSSTSPFANTWISSLAIFDSSLGNDVVVALEIARGQEFRWFGPVHFAVRLPITVTTPVTYTVRASIQGTNITFHSGGSSNRSTITAMEIAP